ncbi:MAG: TonB-dependent receptor, partial [Bacteroidales bacterium]|nr:TonB-dependent receptor [Bacteroidales bacterium]
MTVRVIRFFVIMWFLLLCLQAEGQDYFSGKVQDAATREPLVGVAITQGQSWALTDSLGRFRIKANASSAATFTSLGYKTLRASLVQGATYRLQPDVFYIREVVVTAQENHGLTSATKIGQDAISHIQPSSVADLLELLPGGVSRDPSFGSPKV